MFQINANKRHEMQLNVTFSTILVKINVLATEQDDNITHLDLAALKTLHKKT